MLGQPLTEHGDDADSALAAWPRGGCVVKRITRKTAAAASLMLHMHAAVPHQPLAGASVWRDEKITLTVRVLRRHRGALNMSADSCPHLAVQRVQNTLEYRVRHELVENSEGR
jgi:hypothetical protein